jgi:hypothetical protein
MVILCWLQKSRTWHCAASHRFSDCSFSSLSALRSAFPRAKDACSLGTGALRPARFQKRPRPSRCRLLEPEWF